MHSEHLRNVQVSWVAFGWFMGLAVTSSLVMSAAAVGVLDRSDVGEAFWVAVAVAVGWAIGGFIVGFKVAAAPILHGAAMAVFTFAAWFLLNVAFGSLPEASASWHEFTPRTAALALLVQGAAAIAGCWVGYRYAPVRVD